MHHNVKNGLSKCHNVSYWTTFSWGKSYTAGASNSWAFGGQFACISNGAEGHMSGGLVAYVSNRAGGRMWFWIRGSPSLWATTSEIWPRDGSISKKNGYHLFDIGKVASKWQRFVPVQRGLWSELHAFVRQLSVAILPTFISNFRILSGAPMRSSKGREFDTPDMLYTFLTTESQINRKKIEQFHKGREEI